MTAATEGMQAVERDLIILGAGAAGRAAAFEAAQCGLQVLLIGGGPEALRGAESALRAQRIRSLLEAAQGTEGALSPKGLDGGPGRHGSLGSALEIERILAAELQGDLISLCATYPSIELELGAAELVSPCQVRLVGGRTCEAPLIVIATDGRPRRPERFPFDDRSVFDSESIWRRGTLPRSAVIIGADAAGCALASLLGALRVPVTVIDRRTRTLRYLDRDVLEVFHDCLHGMGVDLVLSEEVDRVEVERGGPGRVQVSLASGRTEVCDALIVVEGREAGTADLRLERAFVETDPDGFVVADERGRTSQRGVFAAGPVVSSAGACSDYYSGCMAVRTALSLGDEGAAAVPLIVESLPEIAMVGLTSEMCERLGLPWVEGKALLAPADCPAGSSTGILKLVAHARSRAVLGVQVIGDRAAELVQFGSLMVAKERSVRELLNLAPPENSPFAAYPAAARDALRTALARIPQLRLATDSSSGQSIRSSTDP